MTTSTIRSNKYVEEGPLGWSCHYCWKLYPDQLMLHNHIAFSHDLPGPPKNVFLKFDSYSDFDQHFTSEEQYHNCQPSKFYDVVDDWFDVDIVVEDSDDDADNEDNEIDSDEAACGVCDIQFDSYSDFEEHVLIYHPEDIEDEEEDFEEEEEEDEYFEEEEDEDSEVSSSELNVICHHHTNHISQVLQNQSCKTKIGAQQEHCLRNKMPLSALVRKVTPCSIVGKVSKMSVGLLEPVKTKNETETLNKFVATKTHKKEIVKERQQQKTDRRRPGPASKTNYVRSPQIDS